MKTHSLINRSLAVFPALAASLATPAMAQVVEAPAATPRVAPIAAIGSAPVAASVKGGNLGKAVASTSLTLDNQALTIEQLRKTGMRYMPARIILTTEKPAGIVKEPTYIGKPRYGKLSVGNGPNKDTLLIIDDKDGGGGKLYVDKNRNGDLTDDGDASWAEETKRNGIVGYGVTQKVVRGSWADPKNPGTETSTGPYSLGIYYREGGESAFMYRQTARVGLLTLNGKNVPVQLIENDSDGIYDRSYAPAPEKYPMELLRPRARSG